MTEDQIRSILLNLGILNNIPREFAVQKMSGQLLLLYTVWGNVFLRPQGGILTLSLFCDWEKNEFYSVTPEQVSQLLLIFNWTVSSDEDPVR